MLFRVVLRIGVRAVIVVVVPGGNGRRMRALAVQTSVIATAASTTTCAWCCVPSLWQRIVTYNFYGKEVVCHLADTCDKIWGQVPVTIAPREQLKSLDLAGVQPVWLQQRRTPQVIILDDRLACVRAKAVDDHAARQGRRNEYNLL